MKLKVSGEIVGGIFAILVAFAVGLTACSSLPDATNAEMKAMTQIALISVVGDDEEQAQEILAAVQEARKYLLDPDMEAPLNELDSELRGSIDWTEMDPRQRVIANDMINLVVLSLKDNISSGTLSPDQMVEVGMVLDWIEEAMMLILNIQMPPPEPEQ